MTKSTITVNNALDLAIISANLVKEGIIFNATPIIVANGHGEGYIIELTGGF